MYYLKLYNSFAKVTIFLVGVVICAGGFVRMTGSGMGCPDWPKCFGFWVPPTSISELPPNYKELYANRGYDKLNFNVFNTWTEYINRLLGVFAGFSSACLLFISLLTKNKKLIFFSFLLVFLMGFQGWMGSIVVASVLSPFKISIHMIIALFILTLCLFLSHITDNSYQRFKSKTLKKIIIISLCISFVQIVLGTQVREEVDMILKQFTKYSIMSHIGSVFFIHRLSSWLVLLSGLSIIVYLIKLKQTDLSIYIILFSLLSMFLTGIAMTYFYFPGFGQLCHLVFAVLLFFAQFNLLLKCYRFPPIQVSPLL